MIKKSNVEKERNRYKTKTTGASLSVRLFRVNTVYFVPLRPTLKEAHHENRGLLSKFGEQKFCRDCSCAV